MYTLIGHPRSRSFRILVALEELGLDYEFVPAPPQDPLVQEVNPSGKVPVLQTDDGAISDSVAILTYLADKHGGLTYPAGSIERARQDALTQFISCEIDAALWVYAKHSFALPESWRVEAIKPVSAKEFDRAMGYLVDMRNDAPFLAGDQFTVPDILFFHCAGWADRINFSVPDGFGPYLDAIAARPAVVKALEMRK